MKIMEIKEKLGKKDVEAIRVDETMTKSAKIKVLFEAGYDVKFISETLGIRYNFAYNVIQNHVIVNGIEVDKADKGPSKKGEIEGLLKKGESLIEVCRAVKCNYNYVWKINQELISKGEIVKKDEAKA